VEAFSVFVDLAARFDQRSRLNGQGAAQPFHKELLCFGHVGVSPKPREILL
jgi:hypothetical protein